MRPNELDRHLHQGSQTNHRLLVIGENEERTTGRNYPSVEHHTHTESRHRKLSNTGLQEAAAIIIATHRLRSLEESISFV